MKTIVRHSRFLALPMLIWFFYNGLLVHSHGKFRDETISQNYFRPLAASFLKGRLDIDCPPGSGCHDLVIYENKYYLYWPPAPALIYMPLVAVFGSEIWDQLLLSIIGAFNVFLFSIFIKLFAQKFKLPIGYWGNMLLTLFWGMGTVHFYMSMLAVVWFVSQVFAQTFLLLALVLLLRNTKVTTIVLSGFCFALACYTRNNLVFYASFIGVLMLLLWKADSVKEKWKKWLLFATPFILLSVLNLYYNHIRFGDLLENGLQYHKMSGYFYENYELYGYFNMHYIPYNFWIEVLCPLPFSKSFPFFQIGLMDDGFGCLWASPLFLFLLPTLFYLGRESYSGRKAKTNFFSRRDILLMLGALLSAGSVALLIFSIMGTGWRQFASRYSLDYQLMLIVFALFIIRVWGKKKWFFPLCLFLVLLSVYINYFGMYQFYNF